MSGGAAYRKTAWFQAVLLGGFAMAAAGMLASGDRGTADAIAERRAEDLKQSLSQVVPPKSHDNDLLADILEIPLAGGASRTVYQARMGGTVVSVAYTVSGFGYGGEIRIIMAVNRNGAVQGVRVLSHAETPGLGDKIEIARDNWITDFDQQSFDSLPPDQWKVKKDGGHFDQFTGATITPRAVVGAVKGGLEFFAAHREQLLATVPTPIAAVAKEAAQ